MRVNKLDSIAWWMVQMRLSISMSIECLLLIAGLDIVGRFGGVDRLALKRANEFQVGIGNSTLLR